MTAAIIRLVVISTAITLCSNCLEATANPAFTEKTQPRQQNDTPAAADKSELSPDDTSQLLGDLDDRHFDRRQQAAQKLVAIGEPLLRPLAVHCLDASPESNWRIKNVIEQIGTEGSEHTFYKSTGILNLLFHGNQAADNQRIQQLIERWRLVRKEKAIEKLRSLGAIIDDPVGDLANADNPRQQWMMANNAIMLANQGIAGGLEVQSTGSTQTAATDEGSAKAQDQRSELNREELVEKIDEILNAELDVNRKRILDDQPSATTTSDLSPLANQQRLLIQANMMGGVNLNRLGVTIELNNKFSGTLDDLQLVRQIPDVSNIRFSDRNINEELLSRFHDVDTIVAVSFDNCSFEDAPLPVSSWPRTASSVAFSRQQLTGEILQSFSDSVLVRRLTLNACELTEDAFEELTNLNAVTDMMVQDTSLNDQYFQMFNQLPAVNRLTLSLCKFDTASYRELKQKKPQLRIDFTPQAFLGIRGTDARAAMFQRPIEIPNNAPADADEIRRRIAAAQQQRLQEAPTGCVVSDVIKGSGAAEGGILPGDLITEIDGQPITQFEDLRLHIAQHKVGEKLDVKVTRDDKPLTVTITLGSFRDANE